MSTESRRRIFKEVIVMLLITFYQVKGGSWKILQENAYTASPLSLIFEGTKATNPVVELPSGKQQQLFSIVDIGQLTGLTVKSEREALSDIEMTVSFETQEYGLQFFAPITTKSIRFMISNCEGLESRTSLYNCQMKESCPDLDFSQLNHVKAVCLLKNLYTLGSINILTNDDVLSWKLSSQGGLTKKVMFCYHGDNTLQFKSFYASLFLCTGNTANLTCITKDWIENYKMNFVKSGDYCHADMAPLKSRPTVTSTTATTSSTTTQTTTTTRSTSLTSLITSLSSSFSTSFSFSIPISSSSAVSSSSIPSPVSNSSSYSSFTSNSSLSVSSFFSNSSAASITTFSLSSSYSLTSFPTPTLASSNSHLSLSSSSSSTSSSSTPTSSPLSVPSSSSSYSFSPSFSYPSSLSSSWSTQSSPNDNTFTQQGTSSIDADSVVTSKVTDAGGTPNVESHPTITVPTTPNLCWCRCSQTPKNLTQEELEMKLRQISSELAIPRKNTSKYIRSKISIEDERASSFYMGSAMVFIIAIPFGLIILMDLSPFFKWAYSYLI